MLKKAFTLVELIVVITILAVLSTIGFISFSGYTSTARDSLRMSDIKTINKGLELYGINTGIFPSPSGPINNVTYSGANVFSQGTFGESVVVDIKSISEVPNDPLYNNQYTYSVTGNKNEFQIGSILENEITSYTFNSLYADGSQLSKAYIKGNYNGSVVKVQSGSDLYILALPSLINSDVGYSDLLEIIENKRLAYNNQAILPSSYSGSNLKVFGDEEGNIINAENILLHTGELKSINTIDFMSQLQLAFSGTTIESSNSIEYILNVDINDTQAANDIAVRIINNNLGANINIEDSLSIIDIEKYFLGDILPIGSKIMMGEATCPSGWTDAGAFVAGGGPDRPEICSNTSVPCKLCEFNGNLDTQINFLTGDAKCRTGWDFTGGLIPGGGPADKLEMCDSVECKVCESDGYINANEKITLVFGVPNRCPIGWKYEGTMVSGGLGADKPEKCGSEECSICSYNINNINESEYVSGTCSGLPANAEFYGKNTTYSIINATNGTSLIANYTDSSRNYGRENTCEFSCMINYTWNGSSCIAN